MSHLLKVPRTRERGLLVYKTTAERDRRKVENKAGLTDGSQMWIAVSTSSCPRSFLCSLVLQSQIVSSLNEMSGVRCASNVFARGVDKVTESFPDSSRVSRNVGPNRTACTDPPQFQLFALFLFRCNEWQKCFFLSHKCLQAVEAWCQSWDHLWIYLSWCRAPSNAFQTQY